MTRWLHVHNGDAARAVLERSGLPGEHRVWAETLHEGPVRGTLPREQWRTDRARFYASLGPAPDGQPEADDLLVRWDAGLARHAEFDEVMLWLEHDLFDQLCLIHHLDFFSRRELGATRLSLVCIGEHPDVPHFRGLGDLSPEQMASLVEAREPVTPEQTALGRRAWAAFVADDPRALAAVAGEPPGPLPFLPPALRRFLEEYPSPYDGLSRTERQVLARLDEGDARAGFLFEANQGAEEAPFMGDLPFWQVLERMSRGPHPLVTRDDETPAHRRGYFLTHDGARVLRGDADAVALNGIDLWRGGVHLTGRAEVWRFDPVTGELSRG